MPFSRFVHLHVHSEYSLLDGACRLDSLIARARELKMPALALTDHGVMYGAVEFYTRCLKHGIKPIVGMEAYVAPESRLERGSRAGIHDSSRHVTLLARDFSGYQNLAALSSIGFLQGFYYRPRIDKEVLARHAQGLLGLSGCLHGEIAAHLLKGDAPLARQAAGEYRDILGPENFYLELMDHGLPEQSRVNRELLDLGRELRLPLAATNDVHYLRREDALAQDVLLCLQTGKRLLETDRLKMPAQEFYLKSGEEMQALFRDHPEAGQNTWEIANRCSLEIPLGRLQLPEYVLSAEQARELPGGGPQSGEERANAYLEHLCRAGLTARYPDGANAAVRERLEKELGVIRRMGFASYFLIVWDFIRFARRQNIPVGPGRGSVAGSLAAYLLEITAIDPLKYGLIFERFLNPERISLPDIDVDFSDTGRDRVIQYVAEKYGSEKVAQIITFGTLAARAAIRDVGRVLDTPFSQVDKAAKLIPWEPGMTLERALDEVPELRSQCQADPKLARLMETAKILEGQVRHASTHAAGVVVSRDPLLDWVPLCHTKRGEGGMLTTQYPMESLEKLGLLKLDFLGLRTLTVLQDTVEDLRRRKEADLDLANLPLDDPATFSLLGQGQTLGLFQLESAGVRDLLKRLQPQSLEEICALIALYRPGPMAMIEEYIRGHQQSRSEASSTVQYAHPDLEPVLRETYGTMVYQEQVMEIAVRVGGFSFGQADLLRRAMSKKNRDAIEQERDRFLAGAAGRGIEPRTAEKIFDQIVKFGEYGFNKSHSLAYALLAYQTAYLKAHFPLAFFAAVLSNEIGQPEKIAQVAGEARRLGMSVLPPDLNRSEAVFTVEGRAIRFGLAAIRHVGLGAAGSIAQERKERGEFAAFAEVCSRLNSTAVNARTMESLAKAGALDGLGLSRSALLARIPEVWSSSQKYSGGEGAGQMALFGEAVPAPQGAAAPERETERLAWEKEVLGFYFSGNPLARHAAVLETFCSAGLRQLAGFKDGSLVVAGGEVSGIRHTSTKRKEPMVRFFLEDAEGRVEVIVWPDLLGSHRKYLEQEAVLLAVGRLDLAGEQVRLVAADLVPLSEAYSRLVKKIHLTLPAHAGAADLERLKRELEARPGAAQVYLHVPAGNRGECVERLPERFNCRPDAEWLDHLGQWLGPERVGLEGPDGGLRRKN